jgi:hypothetical protein
VSRSTGHSAMKTLAIDFAVSLAFLCVTVLPLLTAALP